MNFDRTLVLLRHGRTTWNATGRFQGQADPPLDDLGWTQAKWAAEAITPLRPAAIVSSDLLRAHQTATVLGIACGLVPSTDPALREVSLGHWEGLNRTEAAQRFPDEYSAWADGVDVRRGGGETLHEAGTRAADALTVALLRADPGDVVVAVSHGLALQAALRILACTGLIDLGRQAPCPPHLDNGEWLVCPASARRRTTGRGHAA